MPVARENVGGAAGLGGVDGRLGVQILIHPALVSIGKSTPEAGVAKVFGVPETD